MNFNSIKVRLELESSDQTKANIAFQFHKGTIRTCGIGRNPRYMPQFQFHKGTIRTRNDYVEEDKEEISIP